MPPMILCFAKDVYVYVDICPMSAVGRVLAVRSSPKFRDFTARESKPPRKISRDDGRSGGIKRHSRLGRDAAAVKARARGEER